MTQTEILDIKICRARVRCSNLGPCLERRYHKLGTSTVDPMFVN